MALRDLTDIFKQDDLIRHLGKKKIITARDFLLAEPSRLAPLTYQEAKALKLRVARACAPFAQSGLQTYKEFVTNSAVVPSGVPQVDLILSGGLSTGQILEIFGFSGTGKSEFCHRLSVNVSLNLRKPVLYLHTKGDFDAQAILRIMRGSAPVPPSSQAMEDAAKKIQVAHIRSMEHLLVALPNLLIRTNPRVVIVDSMAALVHPLLGAQMVTLAKLQTVANGLKRAAADSQFALLLVNHRTEAAVDATEDELEPRAAMGTAWQSVPQTRLLFAKEEDSYSVSLVKDAYLPKKTTVVKY
ncbi:DNA repair protein RAD51 homolog 4-like isoform X1 [Cloeon dipterum]|uniref:DNA repair protein RAD51 homolog 4-like isoform X1 n=1 Tax=Cloeon dipterum TaxID=197152 RepID=UPI00321F9A02